MPINHHDSTTQTVTTPEHERATPTDGAPEHPPAPRAHHTPKHERATPAHAAPEHPPASPLRTAPHHMGDRQADHTARHAIQPGAHDDHVHHDTHSDHESGLTRLSLTATLHCMTGCVIGEVVGMSIATALGWSNAASIALAVSLAFVFGYALTSLPLLRAGLTLGAVIPLALATDTASIATMELIDNATIALVPGAMHAHLDEPLYWAAMLGGFVVAFPFAFAVNRYLLQRGKGHALVHQYHQH